jgi:hypothetical protein
MLDIRLAVAAAVLLPGAMASAQDPLAAHLGALVRVTAPTVSRERLVGTLAGANESFLRLSTAAGATVIPRAAVERIQWSRGLHRPVLRRALEFAVVGAGFGLLVSSAASDPNEKEPVCSKRLTCAGVVGGGAAVLGLIAGAVAPPQHDWVDVPDVRRVRVSLQPRPRGVAAALTMTW